MIINLKDSGYLPPKEGEQAGGVKRIYNRGEDSGKIMELLDHLRRQFKEEENIKKKIEIISLCDYGRQSQYGSKKPKDPPVWYEIKSYTTVHNKQVADQITLYTSHYVGAFSYRDVSIKVTPRFGNKIFNHLLGYAANIYLPKGEAAVSAGRGADALWMAAVLWKALLNKALTFGQIPKEYKRVQRNQKNFRGRLVVPMQIRRNLCDASRFYCSYNQLTVDTTINRVVRATYNALRTLRQNDLSPIVRDLEGYDERLAALGVQNSIEDLRELDKIHYTKMNFAYKPVMTLSRTILSNLSVVPSNNDPGKEEPIAYFIDMAELWEIYLLKVLQRNLPEDYHAYSPNTARGDWLLDNSIREIRPDILIEKGGRVVMIIDAKYKFYSKFGDIADRGVSREDLYQMTTYLYHYGSDTQPIVGLFSSPVALELPTDIHHLSHRKTHHIGLLNLDIESANNIETLTKKEKDYVSQVCELLQKID